MRRARVWLVTIPLLTACGDDTTSASADGGDDATATSGTSSATSGDDAPTTVADDSGGSTGAVGECGNGEIEGDEQCDDANGDETDGCYSNCQLAVSEVWQQSPSGGEGLDGLLDVAIDGAGNVYAAGRAAGGMDETNAFLAKYTPDGEVAWTYTYAGPAGLDDQASSLTLVDGDPIIGGYGDDTAGAILARVSEADGTEVWINETMVPDRIDSIGSDGTNIIVGGADVTVMGATSYLAAIDPSGAPIWETTVGGGTVLVFPAGGVIHALQGADYVRLDAMGTETMREELTFPGFSMAIADDGRIAISGTFQTPDCMGFCAEVHVFDADLQQLWDARLDGMAPEESFNGVAFTADGDVIVVGEAAPSTPELDIVAARYTEGGELVWQYDHAGDTAMADRGFSIAVGPADEVVIVGEQATAREDSDAFIAMLQQGTRP